jgi:hypothetical protein
MSQIPPRPEKEEEIMAAIQKQPVVEYGHYVKPPARYSQMSLAVKTALQMYKRGDVDAKITYGTKAEADAAASTLINYRRRNKLKLRISQLDNVLYMWPK